MKKRLLPFLFILILSMAGSIVMTSYFKGGDTIVWPGISSFLIWTLVVFVPIGGLYFGMKPAQKTR